MTRKTNPLKLFSPIHSTRTATAQGHSSEALGLRMVTCRLVCFDPKESSKASSASDTPKNACRALTDRFRTTMALIEVCIVFLHIPVQFVEGVPSGTTFHLCSNSALKRLFRDAVFLWWPNKSFYRNLNSEAYSYM